MDLSHPRVAIPFGLIAGLVAGFLTILIHNWMFLFVGDIFGAVFALYFWVFYGRRSIAKALGLVLASTVAYIAAFFTTMGVSMQLGPNPIRDSTLGEAGRAPGPPLAFFVGGTVGALLVLVAVELLFSRRSLVGMLPRTLGGGVVGGVLGAFGWLLGPSLGKVLLVSLYSPTSPGDTSTPYSLSCFLIWQAGMGVFLSILAAGEKAESSHAVAPRHSWLAVARSIFMVAFFLTMLFVVAFFASTEIPRYVQNVRWHRAFDEHEAEMPSQAGLREVEPVDPDQMLILETIDGYVPGRASVGKGYEALGPNAHAPLAEVYSIRYALPNAPTSGPNVGPHLDLEVREYANAAWAKWLLAEQGYTAEETDNIIVSNSIVLVRPKAPRRDISYYAWVSGARLLIFQCYSMNPDVFLKQYLQIYPSSL